MYLFALLFSLLPLSILSQGDIRQPILPSIFGAVKPPKVHYPSNSAAFKKCVRQLEGIIFKPESAAREYLSSLMNLLVLKLAESGSSPISPESASVLKSFAARYDVTVIVQPSISTSNQNACFAPGMNVEGSPRVFGALVDPNYLNQDGFVYIQSFKNAYYLSRYIVNGDGQAATLILKVAAKSRSFFTC